jgi:hypothetical protein
MYYILAAMILACVVVSNNAEAQVDDIGTGTILSSEALVDHLQPRDKSAVLQSLASQAEQRRISVSEEKQKSLDSRIDRQLNICRC